MSSGVRRGVWARRRWLGLGALAAAVAACDPTYCADLHIEVRTARGAVPPAGTEVVVSSIFESSPGGSRTADTLAHVATAGHGATDPVTVCMFLNDAGDFRIDALDGALIVRGLPLGYPDAPDYPLRVIGGQLQEYDMRDRK